MPPKSGHSRALGWTATALVIAVAGTAGSLWLSMGMGLKACPLCFYQRTFVMAVVGILVTGMLTAARRTSLPNFLALPAATGGLGVAVFHVWLELSGKLECPGGVFGFGTAPKQSLAMFVVLLALLATAAVAQRRSGGFGVRAIVAAFAVGVLFCLAAIKSSPQLPPAPEQPYETTPVVCRAPYQS